MKKNTVYTDEQFAQLHRVIAEFENNGYCLSKKTCYGFEEEPEIGSAEMILHTGNSSGVLLLRIRVINRHNGTDSDCNIGIDYFSGGSNYYHMKYNTVKVPVVCSDKIFSNRMKKAIAACECFKNFNGCFFG